MSIAIASIPSHTGLYKIDVGHSYSNPVLVVITWHTTMDDHSLLMMKIMISGVATVLSVA